MAILYHATGHDGAMSWPKRNKVVSDYLAEVLEGETLRIVVMEAQIDPSHRGAYHGRATSKDGKTVHIIVDGALSAPRKAEVIDKELAYLKCGGAALPGGAVASLAAKLAESSKKTALELKSVIIPERTIAEGVLIKSVSIVWARIVEALEQDWAKAYQIPPHIWEEIIAGAFKKAGYEDVILTPRSGDLGRDVIASRASVA